MINIVLFTRSLNYGGAERQLVNLAKEMDRGKFNPTVLSFYSGPLEEELKSAGTQTFSLEKTGRWEIIGFLVRLYRLLRQLKPDVIYAYLTIPNILIILFKPFFPKTRMIIGLRGSSRDFKHYDWLARSADSLQCILSRFSDLIIVNSKAGFKDSVNQGFPGRKMIVIPNGIDIERFQPNKEAGLVFRKKWGIKDDEIVIGLVGRLHPMKGHSTFLHAASLFAKKRPDVRFVCVGGNGPDAYKNELIALGNELGLSNRLIWIDSQADMPAVFNAFDMVSSSSSFGEGFPNVIGEAMACKKPCVVTDVGDSPWVVGETGIVVPPDNPEALAKGWEEILEDKNIKTKQARLRIVNNFSISHLVQRTEEALPLNGRVIINQPNIS